MNMNSIATALVPTKVKTRTPAANGNVIVQDVLRAAGCDMRLFLTSKQGPRFRRKVYIYAYGINMLCYVCGELCKHLPAARHRTATCRGGEQGAHLAKVRGAGHPHTYLRNI